MNEIRKTKRVVALLCYGFLLAMDAIFTRYRRLCQNQFWLSCQIQRNLCGVKFELINAICRLLDTNRALNLHFSFKKRVVCKDNSFI